MVDIHCHALPGVDDGASSVEVSLAMLRSGLDEGIRTVVLTPHLEAGDGPDKETRHQEVFGKLQEAVEQAGLQVEIHLGSEIGFRLGLGEVAGWPSGTLAGGGQYALVDLPFGLIPPNLEQGFFELRTGGYKAILAHPERQRLLASSPDNLARLREQELLFQVDAGSLTGNFGTRARRAADYLVRRGWAHFVASDAHDLEHRRLTLKGARARVEELSGTGEARRLFEVNPGRAVRGEPLVGPAPRAPRTRRPSLWRRLLGGRSGR